MKLCVENVCCFVFCRALVMEIYYLLADYYFKNKEMTSVLAPCDFVVFITLNL